MKAKNNKKTMDALKLAKQAVDLANNALDSAMQELGDDDLDAVAGGTNPFEDVPRVPIQPIDDHLREKG